jgi:putative ABC transport system permease protein
MTIRDVIVFTIRSLQGFRVRTMLMLMAMAIGVAAVVMLTALGEGARRFVADQFSALGTNLLIILPGRSETTGGPPPLLGETTRDLTLDDALALKRIPGVRRVAPVSLGNAEISVGARNREVLIVGTSGDYRHIRQLNIGQGRFLETPDPRRMFPECVIGTEVRKQMFGVQAALGQWLRLGDRRCRVVGILGTEQHSLGVSMDEIVLVPVALAMAIFNKESLFRVLVEARSRERLKHTKKAILNVIRARHEGEDDVTVIAQDAVLATFDKILRALTYAVAGIAAIALAVAGVLIMNIMLIAVTQRTAEIGLLKAIGAPARQITLLFLSEAATLSMSGAIVGWIVGEFGVWVMAQAYPAVPIGAPAWAILAALGVALITGVLFGIMPAIRAAKLDPVTALSRR